MLKNDRAAQKSMPNMADKQQHFDVHVTFGLLQAVFVQLYRINVMSLKPSI